MSISKLYVGNLTFDATENDLRDLFSEVGEVRDASIISDKMTGRSRGFGFVTMAEASAAEAACEKFDKTDFQGRSLTVNIARPREEGGAPRGGAPRGGRDNRSFSRR